MVEEDQASTSISPWLGKHFFSLPGPLLLPLYHLLSPRWPLYTTPSHTSTIVPTQTCTMQSQLYTYAPLGPPPAWQLYRAETRVPEALDSLFLFELNTARGLHSGLEQLSRAHAYLKPNGAENPTDWNGAGRMFWSPAALVFSSSSTTDSLCDNLWEVLHP